MEVELNEEPEPRLISSRLLLDDVSEIVIAGVAPDELSVSAERAARRGPVQSHRQEPPVFKPFEPQARGPIALGSGRRAAGRRSRLRRPRPRGPIRQQTG